ncbi:hypothetical protein ACU63D_000309 [Vibrio parahaemolyticus]
MANKREKEKFLHHFMSQDEERKNQIMSDVYDLIEQYQNASIETQQLMCSMLNVVTDGHYPTLIGLNGIDAACDTRIETRTRSLMSTAHHLRRELICKIVELEKKEAD